MECHKTQPELATSGSSWTLESWPFAPEDVRQRDEADKDKPKATERLYGADGRLVVAPGGVLPDNAADLLTEDEVLNRPGQTLASAAEPEHGDESPRRKVRRR